MNNRIRLFTAIAAILAEVKHDGLSVNRNKLYTRYGVDTGSPIYFPRRKKVKGWQRNDKGRVVR